MDSVIDYDSNVDNEFIEEARDTISEMEVRLGNMRSGAEALKQGTETLRGSLGRLRLMGAATVFPLLDLCLKRVTDYLRDLEEPTPSNLSDLDTFADVLRGLVSGEIEPQTDEAEFYRSLPTRRPFDLSDVAHLNVEVLLVEPQRSSSAYISRELQSCGYKVTICKTALEALNLTVRTRPDLVISSAVLEGLSGVDLGCAMAAMPTTRRIPFCILTSFERSNSFLASLPDSAAYLRKGNDFGNDLADALKRFNIT